MSSMHDRHVAGAFFWNTVASALNALQGVLFLAVVTRVGGPYMGGIFSFSYMLGQQYRPLGAFEMRVYQVTDTNNRFSFGTYLSSRFVTTLAMIALIIFSSLSTQGLTYAGLSVSSVALLRVLDSLEDVFHGQMQQKGRLDLAARFLSIRILITTSCFCLFYIASNNLILTSSISFLISLVALYFLNIPCSKEMFGVRIDREDIKKVGKVLLTCAPLFLAGFLSVYLPNASKFAIEAEMTKEALTQFSVLFTPAMVINLACGFVFQPLLSKLAQCYAESRIDSFFNMVKRGLYLAGCLGLLLTVLTGVVGIPVLEIVYAVDLTGLNLTLVVLMVAGILNACNTVLYYALVTLRAQRIVLLSYIFASFVAAVFSHLFVERLGLMGGSIAYVATMLALFLFSSCSLIPLFKKEMAEQE